MDGEGGEKGWLKDRFGQGQIAYGADSDLPRM